jgi:hypothetical protein
MAIIQISFARQAKPARLGLPGAHGASHAKFRMNPTGLWFIINPFLNFIDRRAVKTQGSIVIG